MSREGFKNNAMGGKNFNGFGGGNGFGNNSHQSNNRGGFPGNNNNGNGGNRNGGFVGGNSQGGFGAVHTNPNNYQHKKSGGFGSGSGLKNTNAINRSQEMQHPKYFLSSDNTGFNNQQSHRTQSKDSQSFGNNQGFGKGFLSKQQQQQQQQQQQRGQVPGEGFVQGFNTQGSSGFTAGFINPNRRNNQSFQRQNIQNGHISREGPIRGGFISNHGNPNLNPWNLPSTHVSSVVGPGFAKKVIADGQYSTSSVVEMNGGDETANIPQPLQLQEDRTADPLPDLVFEHFGDFGILLVSKNLPS